MSTSLSVLLAFLHCLHATRYYITLQVRDTLVPTSAQFKLVSNSTPPWDCPGGANPITYPVPGGVVSAKSIDVRLGEPGVECLGLNVQVVRAVSTPLWEGEEAPCPGYITSTTELELKDSLTTQHFQFRPTTLFHVYSRVPSAVCKELDPVLVPEPRLNINLDQGVLESCEVTSPYLDLIHCNMTITASSNGEVVAVARGVKRLHVPGFVWDTGIAMVTCSCTCTLVRSWSGQGPTRKTDINYTIPETNPGIVPGSSGTDYFKAETEAKQNDQSLLIAICAVSAFAIISLIANITLVISVRVLTRRVNRVKRTLTREQMNTRSQSFHQLPRGATAPPSFHPAAYPYPGSHTPHPDLAPYDRRRSNPNLSHNNPAPYNNLHSSQNISHRNIPSNPVPFDLPARYNHNRRCSVLSQDPAQNRDTHGNERDISRRDSGFQRELGGMDSLGVGYGREEGGGYGREEGGGYDPLSYSNLTRFSKETHHYNTVSLRLSELQEYELPIEASKAEYQRLSEGEDSI